MKASIVNNENYIETHGNCKESRSFGGLACDFFFIFFERSYRLIVRLTEHLSREIDMFVIFLLYFVM